MVQNLALFIFAVVVATGIGSVVCFVMMQIKMIKNNQAILATVSTVGLCVGGLGFLLAFIYGWIKAKEWGIENFMRNWSALVGISIFFGVILQVLMAVLGPGT